jgi:hypothetical protein
LQYEFITMYRGIREYLTPLERSRLESAGITLFELRPRMRIDETTGFNLLTVALDDVLARNEVRAAEPLLAFYEKAGQRYGVSAKAPAPSPSASESQGAAKPSEQRGTRQAV